MFVSLINARRKSILFQQVFIHQKPEDSSVSRNSSSLWWFRQRWEISHISECEKLVKRICIIPKSVSSILLQYFVYVISFLGSTVSFILHVTDFFSFLKNGIQNGNCLVGWPKSINSHKTIDQAVNGYC